MSDETNPRPLADALLPLAERIAKREPIDWEAQAESADAPTRLQLLALREIAAVEAAHREADRSFDLIEGHAEPPMDVPVTWRHLTLLDKIGEGQFGSVYRAFDNTLQIEVALKLSHAGAPAAPDRSAPLSEARLLARIQHPNVVRVYGAETAQGRAGIWMDLVKGRTLKEMLSTQRFSAAEAVTIGIELCGALAAVHRGGMLHGDVKAHNVIRRDDGAIVLIDFGAGRTLAPGSVARDTVGTPAYMAPEVLRGEPRSHASDIYSLGILLFHLVTDAYPVYEPSIDAAIAAHAAGRQARLRDLRPDLPAAFIDIVERATAANPRARYSSAGALEAALRGMREVPSTQTSARLPMLAALTVAALLAAAGFYEWRQSGTAARSTELAAHAGGRLASAASPASFDIDAAFFQMGATGRRPLAMGERVRVRDEISLSVRTTKPTYLYVVNEDDKGESFLLFPLPGDSASNRIPADSDVRVPESYNWVVDSAGGREHFLVFASETRLAAFEEAFRSLPSPQVGGAPRAWRLPPSVKEKFRGVGEVRRLPDGPPMPTLNLREVFQEPLRGRETASGLWVRRLTLVNDN